MNKKLLAVAIAAALAPVAAMADGNVTVYGQMNVSVDSVDTGRTAGGVRTTQINDNTSRLGFKGTESLGNGLTTVWQIEGSVAGDGAASTVSGQTAATGGASTAGTIGTRNTFVGLTGGFGTAILGRHDTPYKLSTRGLDVFADGIADNRSLMGQSGNGATTFDGRQSNVIAYISPTVSGVTGAIGYVAGAENATLPAQTKGDAWSAMVNYGNGPVYASLAYEKHNVGTACTGTLGDPTAACPAAGFVLDGANESAWKLGLGYTMDALKIGFAYEKTSDNFGTKLGAPDSNIFGHHSYYLSGAYTMGANVLKLAYTKTGDLNGVASLGHSATGAKQWTLGVDHNMSKRTAVYALYSKLSNDTNGIYGLTGGSNGGVAASSPIFGGVGVNQAPSVFSLGMRHSF